MRRDYLPLPRLPDFVVWRVRIWRAAWLAANFDERMLFFGWQTLSNGL